MAWCKITIPPILLLMFFFQALHPCYKDLLEQFCSQYKSLESASLNSIVADIGCHDKFKLVGSDNKISPAGKRPCAAIVALNMDKQEKEWNNPFEWLSTLKVNSLKKQWTQALAGNVIYPICHYVNNRYVLENCPLLKDLNLKLVHGPPPAATPPATTPAPAAPAASPSGRFAMADNSSAANLTHQTSAPSGLVATLAEEEFASDEIFFGRGVRGVLTIPCLLRVTLTMMFLFTLFAFVLLLNISHLQRPLFLIQPRVLPRITCTLNWASTPIAYSVLQMSLGYHCTHDACLNSPWLQPPFYGC
jgi:hypothetical protein